MSFFSFLLITWFLIVIILFYYIKLLPTMYSYLYTVLEPTGVYINKYRISLENNETISPNTIHSKRVSTKTRTRILLNLTSLNSTTFNWKTNFIDLKYVSFWTSCSSTFVGDSCEDIHDSVATLVESTSVKNDIDVYK